MKRNSEDKAERILSIYSRLKQGRVIYKEQESMAFAVAPRTHTKGYCRYSVLSSEPEQRDRRN